MMLKVKDKYKSYLQDKVGIDNYNAFKSILYSEKDTLTKTLFDQYIGKLQLSKEISICDVGGGDGKRIIDLSEKIKKQFGCNIQLDFIEQSKLMCEIFQSKKDEISKSSGVNIFARKIENTELKNTYDLVFFIHSIFCLPNFDSFKQVYEKVNNGGIVIVVSNSGNSFLAKLKNELDLMYEDKRYEIIDLIQNLKTDKIPFEETSFITNWSLNEKVVDENLAVILDWLSLGEFQVLDFFKKNELLELAKKQTKKISNQYLFSEMEKVLVIRKPF